MLTALLLLGLLGYEDLGFIHTYTDEEAEELSGSPICASFNDCGFMASQVCQSRSFADVEMLHYDAGASGNSCLFVCSDGKVGRFPQCGRGRLDRWCDPDETPAASCDFCYVGPSHPCCRDGREAYPGCEDDPWPPMASEPCNDGVLIYFGVEPPRCLADATCVDADGDPNHGCWPKHEAEGR